MKNQNVTQTADDRLNRAIGYSIAFHVALFVAFGVRAVFFSSEPLVLENSIRVDIVALPDKGVKQVPLEAKPAPQAPQEKPPEKPPEPAPKPPPPKAAPVEAPKPAPPTVAKPEIPKVNLDKAKRDQEAALQRLQAMQTLEKSMRSRNEKPSEAPAESAAPPPPIKGNEVSAGNALKGLARLEHQNYLQGAYARIKSQWNLPRWLSSANLSARVRLYIDENGNVTRKDIVRSSNNAVYDERVMAAIEAASPLPPPPSELANRIAAQGIELDFVPE